VKVGVVITILDLHLKGSQILGLFLRERILTSQDVVFGLNRERISERVIESCEDNERT
jgi:hypothetical protein